MKTEQPTSRTSVFRQLPATAHMVLPRPKISRCFSLMLGALTMGCVFDLAPLKADDGGVVPIGSSEPGTTPQPEAEFGTDTAGDPEPGVSPSGPDAMSGTDPAQEAGLTPEPETPEPSPQVCSSDQKECDDGSCVGMNEQCPIPCPTDCSFPGANSHCDETTGMCILDSCKTGFVDCDQDPTNGCEQSFNFTRLTPADSVADATPLDVPRLDLSANPDAWQDSETWADIPMVAINDLCTGCTPVDDTIPPQDPNTVGVIPAPDDLQAGFAMAWDSAALYIRVLVRDDQFLDAEATGASDARGYDNIEFLFDGDPSMFMGDDQHIFIGFDSHAYDTRYFTDIADRTTFTSEPHGQCFIVHGRLTGTYLTGQLSPAQPLPLNAGDEYWFDIGINDYEFGAGANGSGELQLQHHIFYQDPGPNYWFQGRMLPPMKLVDPNNPTAGSDAGVSTVDSGSPLSQ